MFGHGGEDNESIFKLVDQMERGIKSAGAINEPLDVAQHDGNLRVEHRVCSQPLLDIRNAMGLAATFGP
jgi:hypothetical protein